MSFGLWIILAVTLGSGFGAFLIVVGLGFLGNHELNKGEMRRAITAFFIISFGLLVVSSFFPTKMNLPPEIQGLFAGTVATIIGFYFGSRPVADSSRSADAATGQSPAPAIASPSSTRPQDISGDGPS